MVDLVDLDDLGDLSVQLVHKEGFFTARAHFRTKKCSFEAMASVIDRRDVPRGPLYPQGHSGTGGGGAEVVRPFPAPKISFWLVQRPLYAVLY